VRAAAPVGVVRGLSTLIQLLATTPAASASEVSVPATRILDAPRYAWRGLSLDLARTFFTVDEVQRVIDPLALYKLNVLHLHLTDDQSWRLPVGRSAEHSKSDVTCYSAKDLPFATAVVSRSSILDAHSAKPAHPAQLVHSSLVVSQAYCPPILVIPDHR
jgi:hypothetical protein